MTRKPNATASNHLLPFSELSPFDFERMILWLVGEEGFENPQHYGACGADEGRDVIATRPGITEGRQSWYFQCKRYNQPPSKATLSKDLSSIAGSETINPSISIVVFVSSSKISAKMRDSLVNQGQASGLAVIFWAHSELDRLVKKWPSILSEFFNLPVAGSVRRKTIRMSRSVEFFVNRNEELESLERSLTNGSVAGIVGLPGMGKSALAARFVSEFWTHHSFWLNLSVSQPVEVLGAQILDFLCLLDPSNEKYRSILTERTASHLGLLIGELLAREPCLAVIDDISVSNAVHHRDFFLSLFSAVSPSRVLLCCDSERVIAALDSAVTIHIVETGGLNTSHGCKIVMNSAQKTHKAGTNVDTPELTELVQAVGGNPYMLGRLGRMFSIHSLRELRNMIATKNELVSEYVESFLKKTLDSAELELLGSLSLVEGPFRAEVAEVLGDTNRRALKGLLENLAIEKVAEELYRVHSLLKAEAQFYSSDPVAAHLAIAGHYETFISGLEKESLKAVHHYLEANNEEAARLVCDRIFGYCLFKSQFRLVLSWADLIQSDERTMDWPELHYVRGRALRFLGLLQESLQAYKECQMRASGELLDIVLLEGVSVAISDYTLATLDSATIKGFEDTLQAAAESENMILRQGALGALVYLYNNTGRPDLGLNLAQVSLQESIESADSRLEMQGRIKLGLTLFHSFKDYEGAIVELTLGLGILSKRGFSGQDFDAEINAVRALVRCQMELASYDAAIEPARRWKALAELRDGDPYELIDALLRSGQIACMLGLFEESVEGLLKAEKLLVDIDDPNMTLFMLEWLADSLWNIGRIEDSIERILEGARFAAAKKIRWGRHAIASPSLIGDVEDLQKARQSGFHILLLHPDWDPSIVENSHEAIWARRPKLRGISLIGFERELE